MVDVVVLAFPPRDPIRSNTASGDASERCTRAAPRRLLLPRSSKYGGETDWIYNATARCNWWRLSAAGLGLHVVGRERERRAAGRLGLEEEVWEGVRPQPSLYRGVGGQPLPLPQALGPAAKEGGVGGKFPPLLEATLGFCPRLAGWALWGLVPLAQCGQGTPS